MSILVVNYCASNGEDVEPQAAPGHAESLLPALDFDRREGTGDEASQARRL